MSFFSDVGDALSDIGSNPIAIALNPALALGGMSIGGALGGGRNGDPNAQTLQIAREQMALEKEFAQNGISWRVADAAKNGISPLAALGGSTPSYSPVAVALNEPPPSLGHDLLSAGVQSFGASVGRSLLSTQSPAEKQMAQLELARKAKENDLLDVQLANSKLELARHALQNGPPKPASAFQYVTNADGTVSMVPSQDSALASHGQFMGPLFWSFRNKLMPFMGDLFRKPAEYFATHPSPGRTESWESK